MKSAQELACVMASVGLAQNLAVMVGAPPEMRPMVVEEIGKEERVTYDRVVEIVKRLKASSP